MITLARFNETKNAPEGYGIILGQQEGRMRMTGVVYEADGSMDEPQQILIIPSSALAKTVQAHETIDQFTSTKFSRTITRRYISQLRGS